MGRHRLQQICNIEGCNRRYVTRGLCSMHYIRSRKGADMDAPYYSKPSLRTHGHGLESPTYKVWTLMKDRCLNPNAPNYERYGGRGIRVCNRWLQFESFLADMGLRPDGTSIDRINNDGNYEPDNCRWATATEQQRNTRYNRNLTIDGVTRCATEWAEVSGINRETLYTRLDAGWDHKRAVFKPVQVKKARAA